MRWFRRRPHAGACLSLALVPAGLVGCGSGADAGAAAPPDCTPIVGGETTLVGRDLKWNIDCLRVPVGTEVTLTVRLEDEGVKHDLEVDGPSGQAKTELETGPVTQTLTFPFSEPGRHSYVCTIHSGMDGDLFVEEPTE